MQKPTASSLFRRALLCATLALGAGCESTKPRAVSPADSTPLAQAPPPTATPDASTPEPAPTARAASPWQRARVGDRVTYNFSAHYTATGSQRGAGVAGVVTVEVVAVEAPWAWLTLTFASDGGAPPKLPALARSLVLPMRMDELRPLEVRREGVASTEQSTAAGRTWEAKRYLNDGRPADGPLDNRLYAVDPGPLYLTNGLLDASSTLSGFGSNGTVQFTLVEVRQGSASAGPGTKPGMERPLGPGTFYEVHAESGDQTAAARVCADAERGYLLATGLKLPMEGTEKCPGDYSLGEVVPLEERLLWLPMRALGLSQWPPVPEGAAPPVRTTQEVGRGIKVNVVRFEAPEGAKGSRLVRSKGYAADPWDTSLAGLALEPRFFEPLFNNVYRTAKGGKREAVELSRLAIWGTWLPETTP